MKIEKSAVAGTLESSDAQVMMLPNDGGIEINIESSVFYQYGKQIHALAQKVADTLEIENATINITDKGALDCTIKSRIETAYYRSIGQTKNIPWGEI